MDVLALVVTAPGPEGAAAERRHVAPFGVQLHHPRIAVLAAELGGVAVFVEQLGHAFDADGRAIARLEQVLAQVQFGELFAFVAQAIFGRRTRQLETALGAAAVGTTYAGTQVAGELEGEGRQGQHQGDTGRPSEFAESMGVHSCSADCSCCASSRENAGR
ncbi:hypothetical protein D9M69_556640 [compost metagenome]